MHELSIAQGLSAIVLDTALSKNMFKVTKVNLIFGQLIQIVPETFEFAFKEIVRDSIAEDAELNIEILPVKMRCLNCGCDFQVNEDLFGCNKCSSTDFEIIQGKELFIKSMEGE
jgi:hydrogenase nickel incorporation protein HypA/HybF